MTKAPIPTEHSTTNSQHKNATKTSITPRLRTGLGRLVGLTRLPTNHRSRVIKRTHIEKKM